jgi:hypothetical protein
MVMISYCFTAYRPTYDKMLVEDLVRKTTAPYEILIWINTKDQAIEPFLQAKIKAGIPLRIVGKTPENIGMVAYKHLIEAAKGDMVVQIDDDVVRVSRRIAEIATGIFARNPKIKQIAADVVVNRYTWGNRPPIEQYKPYAEEPGILIGSIDGWFSIFHRSIIPLVLAQNYMRFCSLAHAVQKALFREGQGRMGVLCTKFKVFHVVGAPYHAFYNMIDFEIAKWDSLRPNGGDDMRKAKEKVPPRESLEKSVAEIEVELDKDLSGGAS